MNKDQIEGRIKETGGKITKIAGDISNNKDLESQGIRDEISGKLEKNIGDIKHNIGKAIDK